MPSTGTMYSYAYNHIRKEVILRIHIGTNQPIEIVMSAEGFFQDIEFVRKDKKLAHFIAEIKKMKDLPANYDFGPGGSEIRFNPEEWDNKMKEDSNEV